MTIKRRADVTGPRQWIPDPTPGYVQFPDAPRKEEMTSPKYLLDPGKARALRHWLGDFETTLITFDLFLSPAPFAELREIEGRADVFYPDMMIALDVDPQVVANRNGYAISDHGKPPDLIMEVASGSTFRNDATRKREGYAALGVREYWRFNSGVGPRDFPRLSGDRLADGRYEPVAHRGMGAGPLPGLQRGIAAVRVLGKGRRRRPAGMVRPGRGRLPARLRRSDGSPRRRALRPPVRRGPRRPSRGPHPPTGSREPTPAQPVAPARLKGSRLKVTDSRALTLWAVNG